MSDKKCCVPGCPQKEVLHRFPDPEKAKERFDLWVNSIGGNILTLQNEFIHKYRRVCNTHFAEKYYCRNNRISKLAITTLLLPDSSLIENRLLRQLQNVVGSLPSTSQGGTDFITTFTEEIIPVQQSRNLPKSLPSGLQDLIEIEANKENRPVCQTESDQIVQHNGKYNMFVKCYKYVRYWRSDLVLIPRQIKLEFQFLSI
ncbi:uncharacterized protein LOC115444137 [Manduca sexta]|uniref:uncharacterized protein LOC115444137 n=1 Tax=Manduca sexta TaxID=7130 RepID=UPI001182721C|nr:uncharacterized protein LOC115444137 [Manduca sexta]